MLILSTVTNELAETQGLAARLAEELQGDEVIYLEGDLGSGKTSFAQGLINGLGCKGIVTSPTFILQQEYRCSLPILHLDLYRLNQPMELEELGLEEYYGEWILLIEWANLFSSFLPPPNIRIKFDYLSPTTRRIEISSFLDRLKSLKGV